MSHDDYWGATGADLPRVPAPEAGTPSGAPAGPDDLDLTAPLPAVDVPRPDRAPHRPPVVGDEPTEVPLFRATARLPRAETPADAPGGDPGRPPSGGEPDAAAPAASDPWPAGPATGSQPGAQARRLVPVLLLAVAAVAGVVVWRFLPSGGIAVPVPTSAAPVQPAPSSAPPTSATPGPLPAPAVPLPPPLPLPALTPAPVRTITQTVLVTVPALHETPVGTPTGPAASTPSSGSPSAAVTPPLVVTADWRFGPAGVGPITLGMPATAAARAGYLVPDPTAPEGFVTSPALSGVQVWVAHGVVAGVVITDPAIRSVEGVGVGTLLGEIQRLFGGAVVMVTFQDQVGVTRPLPGLEYPATYLAFVTDAAPSASPAPTSGPSTGTPTTPAPTATPTPPTPGPTTATPSPTDTMGAPTTAAPAASDVVTAVIIALKQSPVPAPSDGAPTTPTASTTP